MTLELNNLFELNEQSFINLFPAEPKYRYRQCMQGLLSGKKISEITSLPAKFRQEIETLGLTNTNMSVKYRVNSKDDRTKKYVLSLVDGEEIEVVEMCYSNRVSFCLSSQVGCKVGCTFCATATMGLKRNLSKSEIISQVVFTKQLSRNESMRILFMGMGEPLSNYRNLNEALDLIFQYKLISPRAVTISTSGVIPAIDRLAEKKLPIRLVVSLHSVDEKLRSELIPQSRFYSLERLKSSMHEYQLNSKRRVSIEWALIDGVNDSEADAKSLAEFIGNCGFHVNVIPFNPFPGSEFKRPSQQRISAFASILQSKGVNITVRNTRGTEIMAGCGQLALFGPTR